MKKIGGIIAVVYGVLGLIAAGFAAVYAFSPGVDQAEVTFVFLLFVGATVFSILFIILGIGILRGQNNTPGILLMLFSLLGAVLLFKFGRLPLLMVLPFFGGFLTVMGFGEDKAPAGQRMERQG